MSVKIPLISSKSLSENPEISNNKAFKLNFIVFDEKNKRYMYHDQLRTSRKYLYYPH